MHATVSTTTTPNPAQPPRILRREWKRNKPHLQKSTSLPALQLRPTDRPIFTCQQCGFANTYIPICLWCSWTSKTAQDEFEVSIPRARRASAPTKIIFKPDTPRKDRPLSPPSSPKPSTPKRASSPYLTRLTSAFSGRKRSGSVDNQNQRDRATSPKPSGLFPNADASPAKRRDQQRHLDRKQEQPEEAVYETVVGDYVLISQNVATATIPLHLPSPTARPTRRDGAWSSLAARTTSPFRARHPNPVPTSLLGPSATSQGVDRPNCNTGNNNTNSMSNLSKKSPSCSLSGKPLIVDLNDLDVLSPCKANETSRPNTPSLTPPVQRTLRRRKRIPFFRASSPAASSPIDSIRVPIPPRPVSQPFIRPELHYLPLVFPMTPDTTPPSSRPESPTPTSVRIGHPNRPYYSAIRKNMSRPASPTSTPSRGTTTTTTSASHSPISSCPSSIFSSPSYVAPSTKAIGFKLLQPSCFIDTPLDDDFDDDDSVDLACLSYPVSRSAGNGGSMAFSLGYGCIDRMGSPPSFGLSGQMRGVVGFGGCSVSGETELKMALASSGRRMDEVYRFKDMRDDHGLMSRVKRLRRGLRELMPKKT